MGVPGYVGPLPRLPLVSSSSERKVWYPRIALVDDEKNGRLFGRLFGRGFGHESGCVEYQRQDHNPACLYWKLRR